MIKYNFEITKNNCKKWTFSTKVNIKNFDQKLKLSSKFIFWSQTKNLGQKSKMSDKYLKSSQKNINF